MRKKIYILALALILIFSLSACGSDEEKDAAVVDIDAVIAEIGEGISAAELTDEELSQVEDLKAEMKEKIEAAETEEEKQAIVDEYKAKIEEITSGKMSTETSTDAEEENKDSDSSSQPGDSGDKSLSSNSSSSSTSSSVSSSGLSGNSSSSKPSPGLSGSGSSSSGSGSESTSDSSSTAGKEKVWVVDVPAVYEKEPIYEGRYDGYLIKDLDGNIILKTQDPTEFQNKKQELRNSGNNKFTSGKGLAAELVGYREVCAQEEQGHWEYR